MTDPRRNDKADPLAVYRARRAAGWTTNASGWVAPCGPHVGRPWPVIYQERLRPS